MAVHNAIIIDDGTREIPIMNKFGQEICKIYLRPSDWSILDRYQKFMQDFDKVVDPLKNVGINSNGEPQFENDWGVIKSVESEIKNRIDELLDTKCADGIFATRSAFSIIGGRFYCEIILNAIGDIISEAIAAEMKASAKRVNRFLSDGAKAAEG